MAEPLDMLIVGAGISGIAMAARLKRRCPWARFAIVERRARLGGTWDLFRYPGVRSDSDMSTFGFAFSPFDRPGALASGEEILAYLDEVVESEGLAGAIDYGCRVLAADWDAGAALWQVRIAPRGGGERRVAARWLHLASGYYDHDEPHQAELAGKDAFAGRIVHPQFWPADLELAGQRVAVIGSGATAVSLVPALAEAGARVTMLQRTPSWMASVPRRDRVAEWLEARLPRAFGQWLAREKNIRLGAYVFALSRRRPERLAAWLRRGLRRHLGPAYDPAAFEPPYAPWRQRLCAVAEGDLFAAVRAGKVRVVTGTIAGLEAGGVRMADGALLPADIIVTATGLKLEIAGKIAVTVDGRRVDFSRHFFYRGAMFSNIPNLSVVFGYLNASWTLRAEAVADYVARVLARMREAGSGIAIPELAPAAEPEAVSPFDFTSGYLERARTLMPKSAASPPWQLGQDFVADRRDFRTRPVDDGVLRFLAAPRAGAAR